MTLQDKIQSDLPEAMRRKDPLRLSVLRMMKAAVKNREVEQMRPQDAGEVLSVLKTLVKQRKDSAEQFRNGGREELAQKEEAEITILEEYLPAPASVEEIRRAVEEAIQETGAASMKDMGKVMKTATARLADRSVDGARVSQLAKEKLASMNGGAGH